MGVIKKMEAGVYNLVETQWNTTRKQFKQCIQKTIKAKDNYVQAEYGSDSDEEYETIWKPGGALIGIAGRWARKVEGKGSNTMGRLNWVDLMGKKGNMIKVILSYRVS